MSRAVRMSGMIKYCDDDDSHVEINYKTVRLTACPASFDCDDDLKCNINDVKKMKKPIQPKISSFLQQRSRIQDEMVIVKRSPSSKSFPYDEKG